MPEPSLIRAPQCVSHLPHDQRMQAMLARDEQRRLDWQRDRTRRSWARRVAERIFG